jgi:hypothetical protein
MKIRTDRDGKEIRIVTQEKDMCLVEISMIIRGLQGGLLPQYLGWCRFINMSVSFGWYTGRNVMLRNIPEGLFQFNLDKLMLLDGLVPFICSFFFGATAPIWALAYLHETLRFTSVF